MQARKKRVPSKGRRPAAERSIRGQVAAHKMLPSRAAEGPVSDLRQRRIAEAAYLIAEHEGFPPGRELEHWLRAEAEFERLAAARARRRAGRGLT